MKILKLNKFNFLNESYSDFNQFSQMNVTPSSLGFVGYGFAIDNKLSLYGSQDSPYTDNYYRTPLLVNTLLGVIKQMQKDSSMNYGYIKYDQFLEDLDKFTDFKILRININSSLYIDIYISFVFDEEEYFGVYKNFNNIQKEPFKTDLFTDSNYNYIDKEYRLKLDNYFRKVLYKWFKPRKGNYTTLKDIVCKDSMGKKITIPNNNIVEIKFSNDDKNGDASIDILYKNKLYVLDKNDYYYFNYWFEKIDKNKTS